MQEDTYQQWKKTRLKNYPYSVDALRVEIDGLLNISISERAAIMENCRRYNMAIYSCRDDSADRLAMRKFAAGFGLTKLDHHLCANADGIAELSAQAQGIQAGYVPYSNRSLSWHTDGYYNEPSRQIQSVILHCVQSAESGGRNTLLDSDMAYILLREEDPRFITAFEHPACMTIPANINEGEVLRAEVSGPVFSYAPDGAIHMRFSARKKNIQWRDDAITRAARDFLAGILADENGPLNHYRLRAGEGLISNNVLHNRTMFEDGSTNKRLLYRARFFDRVESS
jgi:hypothetical protein